MLIDYNYYWQGGKVMLSKLGPGELILILLIALLIFGPSKLPELATSMGDAIREFRNAASGESKPKEVEQKEVVSEKENE